MCLRPVPPPKTRNPNPDLIPTEKGTMCPLVAVAKTTIVILLFHVSMPLLKKLEYVFLWTRTAIEGSRVYIIVFTRSYGCYADSAAKARENNGVSPQQGSGGCARVLSCRSLRSTPSWRSFGLYGRKFNEWKRAFEA